MKHKLTNVQKIILLCTIIAAILIVAGYALYSKNTDHTNINANQAPTLIPEFLVVQAKKHSINVAYDFPARTSAFKISEIRPQISGVIVKRIFTEGSFVKARQKLYEIDPIEKIAILAPISGLISRSFVTEGSLVTQNQTEPLATITQLDPIYVDIPVPSKQILKIKNHNNKKVKLFINGSQYPYNGSIKFSEAFINESTDSTIVRTIFKNPEGRLPSGMYVKAQIIATIKNTITLPQRSVNISSTGDKYVLLVNKNGILEQKSVSAQETLDNEWIIDEGIKDGDLVLYEGFQKVRAGMKINPKIITLP